MKSFLSLIVSLIALSSAASAQGSPFCFPGGDAVACPCGNFGTFGNGCANSMFAVGANLGATGVAAPIGGDTVQFTATNVPFQTTTVFFQGTFPMLPGGVFGDGVRCVGGNLVRLGVKFDNGGVQPSGANDAAIDGMTTIGPASGDLPISVLGGIPLAGGVFIYQTYYRNPNAAFCPTATFNITQAYRIAW